MKIFVLITLAIIIGYSHAVEYSVGVSPSIVELGDVQPGSSSLVRFYIITSSDETLLVQLSAYESSIDFFQKDSYANLRHNYSEQPVASWTEFLSNPVELRPTREELAPGIVRGRREVNFLLNIPQNAEPGYHVITIQPLPSVLSQQPGQVGSSFIALTNINVIFNVAGKAKRDLTILNTVPDKFTSLSGSVGINNYIQNTGSVSVVGRVIQSVHNKEGIGIAEIKSVKEEIKPGEMKNMKTTLNTQGLGEGEYSVRTVADFQTGQISKNSTLQLYPSKITAAVTAEGGFPIIYVLIIILILIGAYLYYKKG